MRIEERPEQPKQMRDVVGYAEKKQLKNEVGLFLEMAKAGVGSEGPWHLLAGLSVILNCHCCKSVHISKV